MTNLEAIEKAERLIEVLKVLDGAEILSADLDGLNLGMDSVHVSSTCGVLPQGFVRVERGREGYSSGVVENSVQINGVKVFWLTGEAGG